MADGLALYLEAMRMVADVTAWTAATIPFVAAVVASLLIPE